MSTIPQKELGNNVGEVPRRWVSAQALQAVFATPAPRTMAEDLKRFPGELAG